MFKELDLHVTGILLYEAVITFVVILFIGPGSLEPGVYNWIGVALVVLPQFRIYVRAFWDYPSFKKPKGPYLLINEGQVLLLIGLYSAIVTLLLST